MIRDARGGSGGAARGIDRGFKERHGLMVLPRGGGWMTRTSRLIRSGRTARWRSRRATRKRNRTTLEMCARAFTARVVELRARDDSGTRFPRGAGETWDDSKYAGMGCFQRNTKTPEAKRTLTDEGVVQAGDLSLSIHVATSR